MKTNYPLAKVIALAILGAMMCSFAILPFSEVKKIEGIVYDEFKKPLAGAEVFNVTNGSVAISGKGGTFQIRGKNGDVLKFSYPQKLTREITLKNTKKLKVYFDNKAKLEIKAAKKAEKEVKKRERQALRHKKRDFDGARNINGTADVNYKKVSSSYKNKITGQVNDQYDMPIPGVNIMIYGTTTGIQTDIDGLYGIDAKEGDVLVFSFIGMSQVKTTLGKSKYLNVIMKDEATMLEDVVVEAYRTETRATSNIAVATVSSETIVEGGDLDKGVADATGDIVLEKAYREGDKASAGRKAKERAGQLTAGEVNDFGKWAYWEDIARDDLEDGQEIWEIVPATRYSVVLTNSFGYPVINKTVLLKDRGNEILWTARTDNTGRAELWYKPEEEPEKVIENLTLTDSDNVIIAAEAKEFHEGINTFAYKEKCNALSKVNIAFMVDATGSMGDEIAYLQAELNDVVERTKSTLPDISLTVGSVFYKDHEDDYLVKNFDLTADIPQVISFIEKQGAGGGGDYPEAAVEAFEASIDNMSWDDDARTKLLFVILDAPPHGGDENIKKLQQLARRAAAKGIRIIPIAASGIDKSTEYLMRAMALETNGTYLFITNDSGIGNNHIAPTTDSYKVEMLNDLILRIILQFTAVNSCDANEQMQVNSKIEQQLANNVSVNWNYFPNPTTGQATVKLDMLATELFVYDTTGKLIIYNNAKADKYSIDLSGQPNAVYYIKVMVNDRPLFGKIIKKS